MTRKLIVEPTGELANRLRVLITAHKVAAITDRKLYILWKKTAKFDCELADLMPYEPQWIGPPPLSSGTFRASHHNGRVLQVPASSDIEVLHVVTCFPLVDGNDTYPMSINDSWEDHFKILIQKSLKDYTLPLLHPYIKEQVDSFAPQLGGSIGVHIRRKNVHQLDVNASKSPTSMFFGELHRLKAEKIFLATDSVDEEELFRTEFCDKLFTYPKRTTDRHVSTIAVQDAFIDILLLAKTTQILGSYGSSFNQLASAIGRIPLKIIKG